MLPRRVCGATRGDAGQRLQMAEPQQPWSSHRQRVNPRALMLMAATLANLYWNGQVYPGGYSAPPSDWDRIHRISGALVSAGSVAGLVAFLQWQLGDARGAAHRADPAARATRLSAGIALSVLLVEPRRYRSCSVAVGANVAVRS
jgi:hypothetical protein